MPQRKPNILMIVADDMGWYDASYHGGPIPTPNIDRLTQQGMELDRFYVCPVCSPTRSGLMTGRYPHRFDMHGSPMQWWETKGVPPSEYTLVNALADAGYERRMAIGKWHLGNSSLAFHPLSRGFTEYYGHYCGMIDYYTHERGGEMDWHRDYESDHTKGYSTNLMTAEAIRFIENSRADDPFFLYLAYNAVHTPFQAEPEDEAAMEEAYRDAPVYGREDLVGIDDEAQIARAMERGLSREDAARHVHVGPEKAGGHGITFFGMTKCMDDGIGRVLATLERKGLAEDTLVLFFSDNGGMWNNYPLRGQKGTTREGGVRVAATMRWPGVIPAASKSGAMISYVDILPTFARVAGLESTFPKQLDGSDLFDVLTGAAPEPARALYLGRDLVSDVPTVTNRRWKLYGEELFDLEADVGETTNVAADHRDVVDELSEASIAFERLWGRACRPVGVERQEALPEWQMPDLPVDDPNPA
jgi:arylsulfatase B